MCNRVNMYDYCFYTKSSLANSLINLASESLFHNAILNQIIIHDYTKYVNDYYEITMGYYKFTNVTFSD